MKKLIITGAYGLVGQALCRLLEANHPEIEIEKVKFDLEDHPKYDQYDFIIHAAGYGQPLKFSAGKLKTIYINTRVTMDLLGLLKPDGKFLFVSTSEVYSGAPSPHTEDMIGTTTPQHPRACYIEGKRCGEAICMAYKEQGYDVKIARLALAYGPGTKKGDTRVINQFIEQALKTGEIVMKDDGSAMRTYGYVDSIASMLLDVLFEGKQVVYNVGGNTKLSVRKLAESIAYFTGAKQVITGPASLEGAPDNVELSLTRIFDEFPHTFMWPWEDGIKRTIEYQKQLYGIN